MMKFIAIFLIIAFSSSAFAQVKKSQVLVYGDNEIAWAAAVQSARSGVNTLWIRKEKKIGIHFSEDKDLTITVNDGLDAGLWAELLGKTRGSSTPNDSLSMMAKQNINAQVARNIVYGISDSLKNLNQIFNTEVRSIKKSGKQWRIQLSNNLSLKVSAIVDASEDASLLSLIKPSDLKTESKNQEIVINASQLYKNTTYRTSIMTFSINHDAIVIPTTVLLNSIVAENFFVVREYPWLTKENNRDVNSLPFFIESGQAIGAAAAYCAFFKTTTDKIDIRTLQGELLAYHGQLIPFQDIKIDDPNFSSIQRIGATGLLKGINNNDSFEFSPDQRVSSKEIEPIILALYTRSQIWFNNKNIEEVTLTDLLSLIKFIALKGDELEVDVKKGWKQRFHFSGDYTPDNHVSRRQMAVLVDYYLKPFNVTIDNTGKFKY